ncbi:hypothetical protein ACYSNM_01655 [Myroides sp. LJL116]
MSAFVISVKENEKFKYTFEHSRGRTLLTSVEYPSKEAIYATIGFLQENFELITILRYKTTSAKFYFKLSIDQNIYATSRKFNTAIRFANAIEEVQKSFTKAEILDFSINIFEDIPQEME